MVKGIEEAINKLNELAEEFVTTEEALRNLESAMIIYNMNTSENSCYDKLRKYILQNKDIENE